MIRMADVGYVAGIIDGEGCLRVDKNGNVQVAVSMTDLDVLERCRSITGAGNVRGPRQRDDRKPIWVWATGKSQSVAELVMTIYPLLGTRRQDTAREVLAAWRILPGPRKARCGTAGGYWHHYRRREPVCESCRLAHRAYQRSYYHAAKGSG